MPSLLSDQLREIIASLGVPYAVAKSAGISPGIITRFLKHERTLSLDSIDKLAEAHGLRLVQIARRPAPKTPRIPKTHNAAPEKPATEAPDAPSRTD